MPRFIDISVALEAGIASDPPIMLPEIDYLTHAQTAGQVMSFFPACRHRTCRGAKAGRSNSCA